MKILLFHITCHVLLIIFSINNDVLYKMNLIVLISSIFLNNNINRKQVIKSNVLQDYFRIFYFSWKLSYNQNNFIKFWKLPKLQLLKNILIITQLLGYMTNYSFNLGICNNGSFQNFIQYYKYYYLLYIKFEIII